VTEPGDVWGSFDHDPRQPGNTRLRASDRDRDVIRTVLAAAYADGRLDRGEFDERSEAVTSARTLGELPPVVADLVPERPLVRLSSSSLVGATPADLRRLAEAEWEQERRNALLGLLGSSLVCWAIWVATSWSDGSFDPYFPWPLIVMAVSTANLIKVVVAREDSIRDQVRRLEKKQANQLKPKQTDE
jgi:hypothetical protein